MQQFTKNIDTVIVINGDTLLDIDYKSFNRNHIDKKADITIALTKNKHAASRGIVRLNSEDRVVTFKEVTANSSARNSFTNAGAYVINKRICKYIKKNEKMSLETELIPLLLKHDAPIYGYITQKDYIDIGTPERYKKAQEMIKV